MFECAELFVERYDCEAGSNDFAFPAGGYHASAHNGSRLQHKYKSIWRCYSVAISRVNTVLIYATCSD